MTATSAEQTARAMLMILATDAFGEEYTLRRGYIPTDMDRETRMRRDWDERVKQLKAQRIAARVVEA